MTAVATERVPQTVDAALIARAQAVCERVADLSLAQENDEVTGALAELAGALRFYHRIAAGGLTPEAAYTLTTDWPEGQRFALALHMAAEDAAADAEVVVKVIAEQAGEEGGE